MKGAYFFVLLGLVSFAAMGILHKLAGRFHCDPLNLTLLTMSSALVLTTLNAVAFAPGALFSVPTRVLLIAVPFGFCASAGFWFFQRGLRYGRIATSWLLINLSAAVPAILSVAIYREPLSLRKLIVLTMVVFSLLLLWWDRYQDRDKKFSDEAILLGSVSKESD